MISCIDLDVSTSRRERLFEEVSFEIEPGQWVEWIGPPGTGKSVWFSLLSLRRAPTEGELLVAGRDVARLDGETTTLLRRRIGSTGDPPQLMMNRSVRENLLLPMVARHQEVRADQKVDALLETHDLEPLQEASPASLSREMRSLVGLLRATVGEPDIIALDGGVTSLGDERRASALERLRDCWRRGSLVLVFSRVPSGGAPSEAEHVQLQPPDLVWDSRQAR